MHVRAAGGTRTCANLFVKCVGFGSVTGANEKDASLRYDLTDLNSLSVAALIFILALAEWPSYAHSIIIFASIMFVLGVCYNESCRSDKGRVTLTLNGGHKHSQAGPSRKNTNFTTASAVVLLRKLHRPSSHTQFNGCLGAYVCQGDHHYPTLPVCMAC